MKHWSTLSQGFGSGDSAGPEHGVGAGNPPRNLLTTVRRYHCMTLTWTIIIAWLALQLPLVMLAGKCIKLGMGEPPVPARPVPRVGGLKHASQKLVRAGAHLP